MEITFINEGSGSLPFDQELIERFARRTMPECNLHEIGCGWGKSELSPIQREGVALLEAQYFRGREFANLVTNYGLAGIRTLKRQEMKRVLILTHYSQLFGAEMAVNRFHPSRFRQYHAGFTHIIPGSPFGLQLLKKTGCLNGSKVLKEMCTPFAWYLAQESSVQGAKAELAECCSGAKGKKVLSIVRTGKPNAKTEERYKDFRLSDLMERLGEDWFICTNMPEIVAGSASLPASYRSSFAFLSATWDSPEMAAAADILVTNSASLASSFSGTRKPLYLMRYNDSAFEQYISGTAKELLIEKGKDFAGMIEPKAELSAQQEKLVSRLSYLPKTNPAAAVIKLLQSD